VSIDTNWTSAIATWAAGNEKISEVHLIGSRVKGDHRQNSDLDVAIKLKEEFGYTEWFYESETWMAELQQKLPVEVHLLRGGGNLSNRHVEEAIKDHGVLVYCCK